jgi:colanic acid biosynthesis protein WcaH|tara:strand:+ start:800 stop:1297 length:498 start_codon:yes stop_codon:yes gene_type:complete
MKELHNILSKIDNPREGLPEDVFLLVSQLTPLVNVELLINDDKKGTLLTWRHDDFYGPAWHLPGGIVRFKELASTRIKKVAKSELEVTISFDSEPIEINEIMNKNRDIRGHFFSLLYSCKLTSPLNKDLVFKEEKPINGYWRWFKDCPDNLIFQHEIYRQKIGLY